MFDGDVVEDSSSDKDYEFEAKKRKYDFNFVNIKSSDDLPFKYRHIRDGLLNLKPEIYFVISKLSSDFHMSQNQIEGSIITIANELFGRKEFGEWKLWYIDHTWQYFTQLFKYKKDWKLYGSNGIEFYRSRDYEWW